MKQDIFAARESKFTSCFIKGHHFMRTLIFHVTYGITNITIIFVWSSIGTFLQGRIFIFGFVSSWRLERRDFFCLPENRHHNSGIIGTQDNLINAETLSEHDYVPESFRSAIL